MFGDFEVAASLDLADVLTAPASNLSATQTNVSGGKAATRIPTVLLVDDDLDSLLLLQHILSQFVCEVVSRSDGHPALAYVRQTPPDLIMLDIWLGDINGLDIVSVLKQSPATQVIPIVAVTALARQSDRRTILQAGCAHYISKPYLIEDMEALLRQYLRTS
ncbi:MAG: response regulator [Cyanobacteria bacterium P01_C01_bin.120]